MLSRLRRHRWMFALALVVLAFKLVAGTVCINDAAIVGHAGDAAGAVVHAVGPVVTAGVADGGEGACLLGEAGGCHCTCPESLPVPTTLAWGFGSFEHRFVFRAPDYAFAPSRTTPPLRPPIA